MKKIILTTVMVLTLLYVGLINISYAEDFAKGVSELTGTELIEKNALIILVQANTSTGDEKVEVEKEDEPDEDEQEDEDVDEEDVDDEDVEVGVERRGIRERR